MVRQAKINKVLKRFLKIKKRVLHDPGESKPNSTKALARKQEIEKQRLHYAPQKSAALFFNSNTQLGPPFHILIDTNFVRSACSRKLDLFEGFMNCLYAKCTAYATDCVIAELEKLGTKFRVALRIMKDERIERLPCSHKGTFADDCIVERVTQHKCYIVATNDMDLKRRIKKIPGVPVMCVKRRNFVIESHID